MQAEQIEQSGTIHLHPNWHSMLLAYVHLARALWKKVILLFLTVHSLYGLYLAIIFLLHDYPLLEQQLAAHIIDRATVEDVVIEAVIVLFATVLEIAVAVRLAKKKEFLEETIDAAIGTALLVFASQIRVYIASLEIVSLIMR
ncbi:MAG: hypothetical protein O2840_00820 [bacterium]|nr:hypothetical protein [bacterium]